MKSRTLPFLFLLLGLPGCSRVTVEPGSGEGEEASATHWSYSGASGPEHWAQLDPEFLVCDQGVRQSPIDLEAVPQQAFPDPQLNLVISRLHLLNNGHTIEVALAEAQRLQLDGKEFSLRQFHFHAPSEHTIGGTEFPLEIHFVFRSGEELAVVGVLVREGEENPVLQAFQTDLPRNPGEQGHLNTRIDASQLLPKDRSQFRYPGSLTTPPCTEGVQWIVFREPIQMSQEQIQSLARILDGNNRPRQSLEGRSVILDLADAQ